MRGSGRECAGLRECFDHVCSILNLYWFMALQPEESASLVPRVGLIGGGGHALVVAEAWDLACGYSGGKDGRYASVAGYFDDSVTSTLARATTITRLGSMNDLTDPSRDSSLAVVLCVGDVKARRRILSSLGVQRYITIVHPHATLSPRARVGAGVFIGPRAVVHTLAHLGDHVIINSGAIVEHECTIGANVHIAPGAVLAGNVSIGPNTLVGLGARILPGVSIGSGATIGAGAIVLGDVAEGATVVGVHRAT